MADRYDESVDAVASKVLSETREHRGVRQLGPVSPVHSITECIYDVEMAIARGVDPKDAVALSKACCPYAVPEEDTYEEMSGMQKDDVQGR